MYDRRPAKLQYAVSKANSSLYRQQALQTLQNELRKKAQRKADAIHLTSEELDIAFRRLEGDLGRILPQELHPQWISEDVSYSILYNFCAVSLFSIRGRCSGAPLCLHSLQEFSRDIFTAILTAFYFFEYRVNRVS